MIFTHTLAEYEQKWSIKDPIIATSAKNLISNSKAANSQVSNIPNSTHSTSLLV